MGDLAEGHWSLVEFFETSLRQELRDLDVGVLHMWSDWKELDICSLNEPPMLPVVFCVLPDMYTGRSTIIVFTVFAFAANLAREHDSTSLCSGILE